MDSNSTLTRPQGRAHGSTQTHNLGSRASRINCCCSICTSQRSSRDLFRIHGRSINMRHQQVMFSILRHLLKRHSILEVKDSNSSITTVLKNPKLKHTNSHTITDSNSQDRLRESTSQLNPSTSTLGLAVIVHFRPSPHSIRHSVPCLSPPVRLHSSRTKPNKFHLPSGMHPLYPRGHRLVEGVMCRCIMGTRPTTVTATTTAMVEEVEESVTMGENITEAAATEAIMRAATVVHLWATATFRHLNTRLR